MLVDSFGRTIDYLRVSVTDRCNFRCVYCMPAEGATIAPKASILTYEEITRLLRVAASLGIRKVRLTGGEPLVRKDIVQLVHSVASIPGIVDVSLTTNGLLLGMYAEALAKAGLKRVNISLDTLKPERFAAIARRGELSGVIEGLNAAVSAGLAPLKLNCVVMRGVNDDEAADFAQLAVDHPYNVRFIELMPINWSSGDDSPAPRPADSIRLFPMSALLRRDVAFREAPPLPEAGMLDGRAMDQMFVPAAETRARIEKRFGKLLPAEVQTNGPAQSYTFVGAIGTVGFISQVTQDVCRKCNRIRLTADGYIRPCLMADGEVEVRSALRSGCSDAEIERLIELAVRHKPLEHRLEDGLAPVGRGMSQLGG